MEDLWLIFRCQRGNQEAFAALYDRYHLRVFRTALHLVRDPSLAEDITQEVFIAVFREVHNLRTPAAFRTWLYRLVVSKTSRALRGAGGDRRPLSLEGMPEPQLPASPEASGAVIDREEAAALREAIAALPDDLRVTVLLHYYSGLRVAEVAQVLEIPAGTVKSRLHAARTRLAAALGEEPSGRQTLLKGARI